MRGYDWSQLIWAVIYMANYSVILISLTVFMMRVLPNKYSYIEKAAIGVGILPYLLGVWMILVSFLFPFAGKQYFCIVVPFVLALANIVASRKIIIEAGKQLLKFYMDNTFGAVCFVVIIAILALCCGYNISGYMGYTDAGFYTAEALQFARSLSFRDIASHVESTTHLNGSVHNFVWPAYISYGMMFSSFGDFGLHYDAAMYIGMRAVPVLVLLTFALMCYEISEHDCKSMLIGMALFWLTPIQNIIAPYSRDFFRLLPLMLMIIVLNRELKTKDVEFEKSEVFIFLLIGFAVPSGHPINAFTAFVVGVTWLVFHIVIKREVTGAIKCTAGLVGGFMIGIYNIVYALITTGEVDGNSSLYFENVVAGTDLEQIYLSSMESTTSRGMSLYATVNKIFDGDVYHIIGLCAIVVILSCMLIKLRRVNKPRINMFPTGILISSFFMIFIGHFIIWGSFRYDEWLARNSRYMFQFYFISILAFVSVLVWVKDIASKVKVMQVVNSLAVILIVFTFCGKVRSDYIYLSGRRNHEMEAVGAVVDTINKAIEEAGDKEVWITQTDYAYDTGLRANLLTSYYGQELFRAQTEDDIRNYLDKNNIKFMCFESGYLNWMYDKSKFYQMLINMDAVSEYASVEGLVVYMYSGGE